MDYQRIYNKQELSLNKLKSKLEVLDKHLLTHPADYQARVASVLLKSTIVQKGQLLTRLNYLVNINKYK